jgi:hypothetical protein
MAIFLLLLFLLLYVVTKNSEDYEVAEQYVVRDLRVAAVIGNVQQVSFKFWSGFESVGGTGGHANYSFNATTDKGEFVVEVWLLCAEGTWRVEAANIRRHDGTETRIAV